MSNSNIHLKNSRIVLRELLILLDCSKCKKSLHNSKQILNCGHWACISCININNPTCIDCLLDEKNENFINNDVVKKIFQTCSTIAKELNFIITDVPEIVSSNEASSNVKNEFLHSDKKNQLSVKKSNNPKKRKSNEIVKNEISKKPKLDKYHTVLNNPKKINKRSPLGETYLMQECRKNHVDMVKAFLDAGADPDIPCNAGWTALQESADYNFHDVVELLLKAKANVNKNGCEGRTALHEAAKNNNLYIVQLLLRYGAKKEILDDNGKAPVSYCISDDIKALLQINKVFEKQNNDIKDEFLKKNTNNLLDDVAGPSTSKRITRNSISEINTKINCVNFDREIKAPSEMSVVYKEIDNINLNSSPQKITNKRESPGKENLSYSEPLEKKFKFSQENGCVIDSQNLPSILNDQINDNINFSHNTENNVLHDSEDIEIDVVN